MLFIRLISLPIFVLCFLASCKGQKTFGTDRLKLIEEIPMPDVKGRIDHMAFDPKGQILYVAALGNNSVEAIDLKNASLRQSFKEV